MPLEKNEAQEEAIRTTKGHLLLVSCPGSGKQQPLFAAFIPLSNRGCPPVPF